MVDRIMGVLKADINTFEEIEHDEGATMQAAIVVGVVGLISAIGAAAFAGQAAAFVESFGEQLSDMPGFVADVSDVSAASLFITTLIGAFVTWAVWAYVSYFVGTRLFGGEATPGEMLRVLGYARAPGVLSIVPCLGIVGWIWSLYLAFIALRQGLDIDNGKTVLTILVSFIPAVIINGIINSVLGGIF